VRRKEGGLSGKGSLQIHAIDIIWSQQNYITICILLDELLLEEIHDFAKSRGLRAFNSEQAALVIPHYNIESRWRWWETKVASLLFLSESEEFVMPRYVLGLGASCFEVGGYGSVFGTLSEVLSWKGEVDHRLGEQVGGTEHH